VVERLPSKHEAKIKKDKVFRPSMDEILDPTSNFQHHKVCVWEGWFGGGDGEFQKNRMNINVMYCVMVI
jgi:hypothetical protein